MTTHVLIACSKTKYFEPLEELKWSTNTDIKTWKKMWNNQEVKYFPNELYRGRSFRNQIEIAESFEEVKLHVISAGAGLLSISDKIPSYEATFLSNLGPKVSQWHELPLGGIGKLQINKNDSIVSFAPPRYHLALLKDPNIENIASKLIVPSTSPLASVSKIVIQIHPRAKEVLEVGSSDINTSFLHVYLSEGVEGFERIFNEGEKLQPKIQRKSISDEELWELVNNLQDYKVLNSLVRHLRDDLLIKASVERISRAMKARNESVS